MQFISQSVSKPVSQPASQLARQAVQSGRRAELTWRPARAPICIALLAREPTNRMISSPSRAGAGNVAATGSEFVVAQTKDISPALAPLSSTTTATAVAKVDFAADLIRDQRGKGQRLIYSSAARASPSSGLKNRPPPSGSTSSGSLELFAI